MRIENEFDVSILKRAEDILDTDYGMNITDDDFKGFINSDNVYEMIDELCSEIDRLNEKIEDMEEQYEEKIRDFYNPKSSYEIYGISERDFV